MFYLSDNSNLHGDLCELLADPLVYLQVFGHTPAHQAINYIFNFDTVSLSYKALWKLKNVKIFSLQN